MPLWIPLEAIAIPTAFLWWRSRRRFPHGYCQGCGYDLTGNVSGRCPECGREIDLDALVEPVRRLPSGVPYLAGALAVAAAIVLPLRLPSGVLILFVGPATFMQLAVFFRSVRLVRASTLRRWDRAAVIAATIICVLSLLPVVASVGNLVLYIRSR